MRFGLSMFGTTYAMGLHPRSTAAPMTAEAVLYQAVQSGLQGAELPAGLLAKADQQAIIRFAREHELYLVVAEGGFDPERLGEAIALAKSVGASVVRTVAGGAMLGGDRRHMAGGWQPFLAKVREGLAEATAIAEQAGVTIAIENHQDLASEELIWLCESISSHHIGLTLDTGNPLATAEEPVDFARRIAPYLKNVHLKDYWIHPTDEGYRLVRCPIGQGAVDFPALMDVFRTSAPASGQLTMSIEIGALEARHVRVLADDYWPEYPPRSAQQLAQVMRFVQQQAKPAGAQWQTPHERGESVDAVIAYEQAQLMSSIAYVHQLMSTANQTNLSIPSNQSNPSEAVS
ncbi:sugar phosphate isomerase/epimerase [Paenibacillus taihuensis]|uniref:Sugar phosphate isomerase/epimerase n=1 Tax=Paenibacillus taihuensis TaxID=1156355 RepID=A0A3D9SNL4_9BACL|nr:sugar phosphate isomerase/epimerase [Paenibacillus taihuensis]REE93134.1 sugar phosphate isomerase/epimerase [Paenibacillus taihuensis]